MRSRFGNSSTTFRNPRINVVHFRQIRRVEWHEPLARWPARGVVGIYGIVAKLRVLDEVPDHVNAKTVDTLTQPETHDLVHCANHLGIPPVQIRLREKESVIIILTCSILKRQAPSADF